MNGMAATPGVPVNPAMKKAALLQAVAMLDGLVEAFGNEAPENVQVKSKEFRDALKDWAENGGKRSP